MSNSTDDIMVSPINSCNDVQNGAANDPSFKPGTIRYPNHKTPSTPDFSVYQNDFIPGPQIPISNIDGATALHGHLLFREYKRYPKEIPQGQVILKNALLAAGHTIIWIWYDHPTWSEKHFVRVEIFLPAKLANARDKYGKPYFKRAYHRWIKDQDFQHHKHGIDYVKAFHRQWAKAVQDIQPTPSNYKAWKKALTA